MSHFMRYLDAFVYLINPVQSACEIKILFVSISMFLLYTIWGIFIEMDYLLFI